MVSVIWKGVLVEDVPRMSNNLGRVDLRAERVIFRLIYYILVKSYLSYFD